MHNDNNSGRNNTIIRPRPGGGAAGGQQNPPQQPIPPQGGGQAPYPPQQMPPQQMPPQGGGFDPYGQPPQQAPQQAPQGGGFDQFGHQYPNQQPPQHQPSQYQQPPQYQQPGQQQYQNQQQPPQQRMQSGPSLEMNPLVDCAGTILSLVTQLKNTASHPDIRLLYQKTVELVREYERQLRDYQIDPETVFNARYALCALIDETVLNTPWGSHSFWSTESLLTSFHRETWGGEHVYQILEIALRAPDQSRNILELIYICMSLGFMGKLRVVERGTIQHDEIRDRIFRTLRPHMGDYQKELSPQWQSNEKRFNRLRGLVPTWVIMSVLTLIIVGVYMGFSWHLNELSNPVHTDIHALVPWGVSKEAKKLPPPVEEVDQANKIRRLLQPEIQKGLVEIEGIPGQITIMLNNKGLFASGTAKVATAIVPVLQKIADALDQTEGEVFVIGHTDNIPIFTPKFPSNWHLSVDRAKAVSAKIATNDALKSRITAEGRGDTEPLYPNDTSKNRALNRRVEIILLQ